MSLLTPFARWFSLIIWSLLSLLSYIYSIAIVRSMLPRLTSAPRLEFLIAPILLLVLIYDNIQLGQTNMIMLFAILVSIHYLTQQKNLKAGLAMAFAIAYKVTPLIFVGYFILKRRYWAAAYTSGFTIVMIVLVPMLFYSPEKSLDFFVAWTDHVLATFLYGEELKTLNVIHYHTNQSLEAFLTRHFTSYGAEEYGGLHVYLNPVNLSSQQVGMLGKLIKMFVILLLSFICFFNKKKGNMVVIGEVSLFLMAILIISPAAWVNHYIIITPVIVYFVHEIFRFKDNEHSRRLLIFTLIMTFILMLIGIDAGIQSYSVFFIALALLFSVTVYYHYKYNFLLRKRSSK